MANEHYVALFAGETISDPSRRIRGLKAPDRGKLSQGVAHTQEWFGGLSSPELTAVPDRDWLDAARGRIHGQTIRVHPAGDRERPLRIDVGADGVGVVDEVDHS